MRKQVVPLLCLFFLLTLSSAAAAQSAAQDPIPAGCKLLYQGNFGGAYDHFHALLEREPGSLAATYGVLSALYHHDLRDAAVQKEFEQRAEALIQKADKRYSRNKRDAEAHFYLAQMHGVRAAYRYQYRNSLWGAARDGIKSKKYSDEFVKLHPDRADAYIALGLYNYYVDLAPSFVKVLRILLFLPGGSRSEGLEQLEHAAHAGELWAPQAQLELIQIYGWLEGRVEDALRLAEELQGKYPENPELRFRLARLYTSPMLEAYRLAAGQYATILERHQQGHPHYKVEDRYKALLGLARVRNRQGRLEEAVTALTPIVDAAVQKPQWVLPRFLLRRADYRALLNDPRAGDDARRILAEKQWKSWHDDAKQLLRRIEKRRAFGEAARYAELLPGHRLVVGQRWEEAAQFYQRRLQQHPGDWQVRYRLAWLAFARGRLEQAAAAFNRILRGKSGEVPEWVRAGSLLHLARVHDLQGEREQAVKLYEKIVDDYEDLSANQSARLGLVTPYRRVKLDAR